LFLLLRFAISNYVFDFLFPATVSKIYQVH
jgi:hypothetical protein